MDANKQRIAELEAELAKLKNGEGATEEERPNIHPKLIVKMADGKASTEDMKYALILRFIKDAKGLTLGQVAKAAGLSVDDTRKIVQEMKRQTIVRSEGARRATRYFMVDGFGTDKAAATASDDEDEDDSESPTQAAPGKRRPGRPRKNQSVNAQLASA